jgi:hypothetical protein
VKQECKRKNSISKHGLQHVPISLYAKYYFALRSLLEKKDFCQRYNHMVGAGHVEILQALNVQKRTEQIKEEAILQLSRSM